MFNMKDLDAVDGNLFSGENQNDVFEKDNLMKVGLSEGLSAGLDGKTVGDFQEILIGNIKSGANVNFEMLMFGKELFASFNNTGYENNEANSVISDLENRASDNWLNGDVQGLSYLTDLIEGKCGTSPLPEALQPKPEEPTELRTGYYKTRTAGDEGLQDISNTP